MKQAGSQPPVRYEKLRGQNALPQMSRQRMTAIATAPFFGSRWIFPGMFAAALTRLSRDGSARSIPSEYAFRYFRQALVVNIDPAGLKRQILDEVTDGRKDLRLAHRFLDAGNWSDIRKPFDHARAHREILELLNYSYIEETPTYRSFVSQAKLGQPKRRNGILLTDEASVRHYLEQYRRLLESVQQHGLLPRHAVPPDQRVFSLARTLRVEWWERDTGLAVDAKGRLLRIIGGRHRTAIAKILGLRSMPAEIRLVHVRWLQRIMDETRLPPHQAILEGIARAGWLTPARGEGRRLSEL